MINKRFKQTISAFLLLLLLFSTVACGQIVSETETQESQNPDATEETNDITQDNQEYLTLYQNNAACFNIVFDKNMDMSMKRYEAAKNYYIQLCSFMGATIGSATAPKLMSDAGYVENDEKIEILWGKTACKESIQVFEESGWNEFGYRIIGNKIVIYGHTLEEIKIGADALKIQLTKNAHLDDNGNIVVKIPATQDKRYSDDDLAILELPTPTVGSNLLFCDDGDEARMWVAEGCKAADFDTYTSELMKAGFSLYSRNENTNNLATGEKTNKYATYKKDDIIADVWYTVDGYLRITASRGFDLPSKTVESYKKKAETGLFIVGPTQQDTDRGEQLMFFRLEDGSFFIIDGGWHDYMWEVLLAELQKQAPDKNNIVIRCWMFTHSHMDHIGSMQGLVKNFNRDKNKIKIESFMYNFAGYEQASVPNQGLDGHDNEMRKYFSTNFPDVKKYKVHPGNEFDFANLHVEVLTTHESSIQNQYPLPHNACNTAVKITVEGQTIIVMGDTSYEDNVTVGEVYGDYLECDILQAAHHGVDKGGIVSTNLLHKPKVVLFLDLWEKDRMQKFIEKDYNQALVDTAQNPNFKEYICHDRVVTYLPLPYTPGTKVITQHAAASK